MRSASRGYAGAPRWRHACRTQQRPRRPSTRRRCAQRTFDWPRPSDRGLLRLNGHASRWTTYLSVRRCRRGCESAGSTTPRRTAGLEAARRSWHSSRHSSRRLRASKRKWRCQEVVRRRGPAPSQRAARGSGSPGSRFSPAQGRIARAAAGRAHRRLLQRFPSRHRLAGRILHVQARGRPRLHATAALLPHLPMTPTWLRRQRAYSKCTRS